MRTRTRPAAGFSLLELTIVIGIILLLAALVVAVSTAVIAANEKRNTQNTLAMLDAAMKEWERQVDRPVSFQNAGNPPNPTDPTGAGYSYDIVPDPTIASLGIPAAVLQYNGSGDLQKHRRRTVALIELIAKQPDVESMLARLPDDTLRRIRTQTTPVQYANVKEVVDAWGNPIVAIFPGRAFRTGESGTPEIDGSIRTVSESTGPRSCRNRQVLFVSGGPDGILVDNGSTGGIDESADNLYSYGEEGQ
jgi:type II secretory pathway pseudopilin PulG